MQSVYIERANGTQETPMLPLHIIESEINSWNTFRILHIISPKFFFFICIEMRLIIESRVGRQLMYRNGNVQTWQETVDAITRATWRYRQELREVLNTPRNSLRIDGHIGALREEWFVSILTRG